MQLENNYDKEVYNGDSWHCCSYRHRGGRARRGFDGREVVYQFGPLDKLVLVYAMTIHKSQGLEYPAVVVPVTTQHYTMLQRNLLYTGVTRGQRLVVLLRQRRALVIAVKRAQGGQRWSKLAEWLR